MYSYNIYKIQMVIMALELYGLTKRVRKNIGLL
jgi:hypothetical protein